MEDVYFYFVFLSHYSTGVLLGVSIPVGTPVAILEAMNYHPTSEKLQVEGCLDLGNIGRAGEEC